MNDPIKVRQPGGVLEFVQQPNTNYYAESPCGNYGFKVWRGVGNAHLEVFDGSTEEIFYVKSPAAIPPTTLFAIAETIHARLTGREQRPAESVNAELLEALKQIMADDEQANLEGGGCYTDAGRKPYYELIARAEAQQ